RLVKRLDSTDFPGAWQSPERRHLHSENSRLSIKSIGPIGAGATPGAPNGEHAQGFPTVACSLPATEGRREPQAPGPWAIGSARGDPRVAGRARIGGVLAPPDADGGARRGAQGSNRGGRARRRREGDGAPSFTRKADRAGAYRPPRRSGRRVPRAQRAG